MNSTKSWACYLWLLTIELLEQLFELASNRNPAFAIRMQLRGGTRSDRQDTRSLAASCKALTQTTGIQG